VPEHIPFL